MVTTRWSPAVTVVTSTGSVPDTDTPPSAVRRVATSDATVALTSWVVPTLAAGAGLPAGGPERAGPAQVIDTCEAVAAEEGGGAAAPRAAAARATVKNPDSTAAKRTG